MNPIESERTTALTVETAVFCKNFFCSAFGFRADSLMCSCDFYSLSVNNFSTPEISFKYTVIVQLLNSYKAVWMYWIRLNNLQSNCVFNTNTK